jgi:hypothetical protein
VFSFVGCGKNSKKPRIELALKDESTVYTRTEDIAGLLQFRVLNADKEIDSEWLPVPSDNVTSYSIADNKLSVTVTVTVRNVKCTADIKIPVQESVLSVNEILKKDTNRDYMLSGIVVSYATTVDQNEILLMDKSTGDLISVTDIGKGQVVYGSYYIDGISIGDEVILPVILRRDYDSSIGANSGKTYAKFTGGEIYGTAVVSKANAFSLKEDAAVIDSQADLVEFLSEENRSDNIYKTVKLRGEMSFTVDTSYELFNFWFYDNNAKRLSDLEIDGITPAFSGAQAYYSTSNNLSQLVFGNNSSFSSNINNAKTTVKEIVAVFIGGNSSFSQFVILSENDVKDFTPVLLSTEFTAPMGTKYPLNSSLDITGARITKSFDTRTDIVIDVTEDMIDKTTVPNFKTAGDYIVKGVCDGYEFSFNITVINREVSSLTIENSPEKTLYGHRDKYGELDFTGGKLRVSYTDGTFEIIDMAPEMLRLKDSDAWKIGKVNYALEYLEAKVNLAVDYEVRALSIAEFLSGTVGEKYEVTGIVVGVGSCHASADLLIKDKNGMDIICVKNTEIAGAYNNPKLDKAVLNVGDEIVFTAELSKITSSAETGNKGKLCAAVTDIVDFRETLIVASSENPVSYDFSDVTVTEISTQEELISFLKSEERFYSYVKLVGVKAVVYSNTGYRIFFGSDISSLSAQKVNGASPYLYWVNCNNYLTDDLINYFENGSSTSYSSPATASCDIYAVFIGGNANYHDFIILDDSWMISK